jgi:pimeloyl-ACP methyl ester carboxylesterase
MTVPDRQVDPFTLDIDQSVIDDLHDRLDCTRWSPVLPGAPWAKGVPVDHLRDLVAYWRERYDWRTQEAALNAHPQFTTHIDGAQVHFLHVTSPVEDAMPLLSLHGWPGSVVEFLDVIGPLTDPAAHGGRPEDAVHVVIPSLPGFGLSGAVADGGWTERRIAAAMVELMDRLGYARFGVQGGDLGAGIGPHIGRIAPDRVVGIHVNAATVGFMPFPPVPDDELAELTDLERDRVARIERFMADGFGYAQIMGTRPATLAHGLADSPVGQLAWIIDKFKEWTHPSRDLPETAIDRDRMLTNVMLYWLTNTAASSSNVYWEGQHDEAAWAPDPSSGVPTGVLATAEDIAIRRYAEASHDIVHWTDLDTGGHFAALEIPELLVDDVRTFFAGLHPVQ